MSPLETSVGPKRETYGRVLETGTTRGCRSRGRGDEMDPKGRDVTSDLQKTSVIRPHEDPEGKYETDLVTGNKGRLFRTFSKKVYKTYKKITTKPFLLFKCGKIEWNPSSSSTT